MEIMQRSFEKDKVGDGISKVPTSPSITLPSTSSQNVPISAHDLSDNKTENIVPIQQDRKDQDQPNWKVAKLMIICLTVIFLVLMGIIIGLVVHIIETGKRDDTYTTRLAALEDKLNLLYMLPANAKLELAGNKTTQILPTSPQTTIQKTTRKLKTRAETTKDSHNNGQRR